MQKTFMLTNENAHSFPYFSGKHLTKTSAHIEYT